MNKIAICLSLLLTTVSASADIVVACFTEEKVIEAVYNPPVQTSPFAVYSATTREVLGAGEFTQSSHFTEDSFLDMTMIAFQGDAGVLGVAFDDPTYTTFEELIPGKTYAGKADVFVQYGAGDQDVMDGSTLNCEIRVRE